MEPETVRSSIKWVQAQHQLLLSPATCLSYLPTFAELYYFVVLMEPRRIQQLFSCCPTAVGTYAAMNLDSLPKVLNHLLLVMICFNLLLFMNSWNVSYLPVMGFNTVLSAFLLCFQNIVVWLILNNNRISALSFLSPTDFMVGVALGITVGGSILAFVICLAFRHMSQCETMKQDSFLATVCQERRRNINAVWFWSGLVFWTNFCVSLLLSVGRGSLTQHSQYESIGGSGMTMEDYEGHFRQHQGQGAASLSVPIPPFVGDYATIPEIRSAIDSEKTKSHASNIPDNTDEGAVVRNV